ncbi:hypothetical protein A7A08_02830 [Methyloligella halotolerans]|uniref:Uncharacterized protein n=1 Tax=Methyloligella halotolerans TaxID=1177755 RepID=A0A1E2RVE3_9HYPH|nr:hypothetical protein [Methyloligella halotolerans]ODA66183.1 hypothetical protein A7A08_02830 [Methyloligella halotolerans]
MASAPAYLLSALLLGGGLTTAALAADDAPAESPAKPSKKAKRELTPEEKAEKASRRACKVEICKAMAGEVPAKGVISCDIVKTWREEDIQDMVGDRMSWPWGKAVCNSKLKLDRKDLRAAMTKASHKVAIANQTVTCRLDRKGDEEPYEVVVDLAPEVAFKNGKATKASANWGDVDAPFGIYPIIYSGTGLDNQTNVLGPEIVKLVNEFTGKKCAEVGAKPEKAPAPKTPVDEDDTGPAERKVDNGAPGRTVLR